MAKYFIHAGLQFQTISVLRNTFTPLLTDATAIDAVILSSVSEALGADVLGDTGATDADKMENRLTALKAIWTATRTDRFWAFAQDTLKEEANLLSTTGIGEAEASDLHRRSWQYILPVGFSNALTLLPGERDDAGNARDRISAKALEVRHDNIAKHATAGSAWDAWTTYEIAREAGEGLDLAKADYFINPNA